MRAIPGLVTAIVVSIFSRTHAQQCAPQWNGGLPALDGSVRAMAVFNDGTGPALYAGGTFTTAAGGQSVARIAKWDGSAWRSVGGGLNGPVFAMQVWDDGSGPALYVGGAFTQAGVTAARGVAKWNGVSWSSLGVGVHNGYTNIGYTVIPAFSSPGVVFAMAIHDDGAGPSLFVGGEFDSAGPVFAQGVARWNGAEWGDVGASAFNPTVSGPFRPVYALCSLTINSAPILVAGGAFSTSVFGPRLERLAYWDRVAWQPVEVQQNQYGGLGSQQVTALLALPSLSGQQPALLFATSRVIPPYSNLDPTLMGIWRGPGTAAQVAPGPISSGDGVRSLSLYSDGVGLAVYAGSTPPRPPAATWSGVFRTSLQALSNFPSSGTSWENISGSSSNLSVDCLLPVSVGSVPGLYAGGSFTQIGGVGALRIARFGCPGSSSPTSFPLLSPSPGAVATSTNPTFSWAVPGSASPVTYTLIIAQDDALTQVVYSATGLTTTSHTPPAGTLQAGVRYRWGVRVTNLSGPASSSPISQQFATRAIGDTNGDGVVDFLDLSNVIGLFGVMP